MLEKQCAVQKEKIKIYYHFWFWSFSYINRSQGWLRLSFCSADLVKMPTGSLKYISLYRKWRRTKPTTQKSVIVKYELFTGWCLWMRVEVWPCEFCLLSPSIVAKFRTSRIWGCDDKFVGESLYYHSAFNSISGPDFSSNSRPSEELCFTLPRSKAEFGLDFC